MEKQNSSSGFKKMFVFLYVLPLRHCISPPPTSPQLVAKKQRFNEHSTLIPVSARYPYRVLFAKVKETVRASLEETGADKALLVAHSAGGWLARAALAEGKWEEGVASQDVVAGESMLRRREGRFHWTTLPLFCLLFFVVSFMS